MKYFHNSSKSHEQVLPITNNPNLQQVTDLHQRPGTIMVPGSTSLRNPSSGASPKPAARQASKQTWLDMVKEGKMVGPWLMTARPHRR